MEVKQQMNRTILQRIQALEARKVGIGGPADDLSASLAEFGRYLAGLDEAGVAAEAEILGISPGDVRQMAKTYNNF